MSSIEVDLMWRRERVIVEVDGWASHGTHAARRLTREPEAVLVEIATALALRR